MLKTIVLKNLIFVSTIIIVLPQGIGHIDGALKKNKEGWHPKCKFQLVGSHPKKKTSGVPPKALKSMAELGRQGQRQLTNRYI